MFPRKIGNIKLQTPHLLCGDSRYKNMAWEYDIYLEIYRFTNIYIHKSRCINLQIFLKMYIYEFEYQHVLKKLFNIHLRV